MSYTTISQMFDYATNQNLTKALYYYKNGENWVGLTGLDIRNTVTDLAFGLRSLGVESGQNVAILSNNSPRWAMSDYGVICSGAATVSIYPTLIPSQIEYILNDSESSLIFIEDQEQFDKIKSIWKNFKGLPQTKKFFMAPERPIIYFDEIDRPQPKLDLDLEKGMAITVGRLVEDKFFDARYVSLSHNTVRGAAGGAILMAELLIYKGYIHGN